MKLKAYSIIVNITRGFIEDNKAVIFVNSVIITDKNGAHEYQNKDTTPYTDMNAVIGHGYNIAINNGYQKPKMYQEFNALWFNNICVLDCGTLHNYPYKGITL